MKTKCELCKCLNMIGEAKKNPSKSLWVMLNQKWALIQQKRVTETFCDNHRVPIKLNADLISVGGFIGEVLALIEKGGQERVAPAMVLAKGGYPQ